jgi:hypothetical protein
LEEASAWKAARAIEIEQTGKRATDEMRTRLLEYIEPAVFDGLDVTIATAFSFAEPWWRGERWARGVFDLPYERGSVEIDWVADSRFELAVYKDIAPAPVRCSPEGQEWGEEGEHTEVCRYEVAGEELQRELLSWYLANNWPLFPPIDEEEEEEEEDADWITGTTDETVQPPSLLEMPLQAHRRKGFRLV